MAPLPEPVYLTLFAAVFVLIIVLVFLGRSFERLLRERHPEVLEELKLDDERHGGDEGEANAAMLRFVWRREYRRLRDKDVTRAGDRMRALLVPVIGGFAALFLAGGYQTYCEHAGPPQANAAEELQEKRNRALTLHNQGRVEDAIRLYDELLGPVAADGELVYWRGVAHWKAGREDQALVDFRRVMDLNPGWFEPYLHADRILSRQRRFDDCVDLWTRYLRVVPGDATAYFERGGAHFNRGDFAAAHADTRRACELGKAEACVHAERMKARL